MSNIQLIQPPAKVRKECVSRLTEELRQLSRSATILDVAKSLSTLRTELLLTASTYGINLEGLPRKLKEVRGALERGSKDALLLDMPLPGRAARGSVRKCILKVAEKKQEFTADDVIVCNPFLSRRSLKSNLANMTSRHGILRRVRKGKKGVHGTPPTYALKDAR